MRISLCIICKDEEKKIARCINSVKSEVDEIVVVDTGSKDKTVEIVKELGAKVYEIPWENDFSKAKNAAIEKSTGDWIIFLDADEYFTKDSVRDVRRLIKEADKKQKDYILCEILNEDGNKITSTFKTIRVFKHSSNIKYEGRIHEKIYKEGGELKGIDFLDSFKILHDGYCDEAMIEKNKADRNLELLLESIRENPTDGDLCYYLMQAYNGKDDVEKVWEYANKTIEYNGELPEAKIGAYERLLHICTIEKKDLKTIQGIYDDSIKFDAYYPDFEFRYGEYFYHQKQYTESARYLIGCLEKLDQYKGYAVSGIMGNAIPVLDLLSKCYLLEERYGDAVPVLVKILQIQPYEFTTLYNLIKILEASETGEAIGEFLGNLYDYTNLKDQMVLVQMSQRIQNEELLNYLISLTDERVKKHLNLA